MQKILKFILLAACVFSLQNLSAQSSFCAGINVTVIPLNPQSGPHNYFGVKVTLDMTYDQNVTVTGYIYDYNDYNTSHPFSVTVTAGNLTNQTSATFYETDPTLEADITIGSKSPSTVTKNEVNFSTACSTSDPIDRLTSVGALHNGFMDAFYDYLGDQNIDLRDTSSLKTLIASRLNTFLTNNGLPDDAYSSFNLGDTTELVGNFTYNPTDYSTAGASILSSLQTLIANLDPENDAGFISSLEDLQSDALSLSNPMEWYTVGIPVTVAIYSYNFYKNSSEAYIEILLYQDSIRQLTAYVPFAIPTAPYVGGNTTIGSDLSFSEDNIFMQAFETPKTRAELRTDLMFLSKPKFKLNGLSLAAHDIGGAVQGAVVGALAGPGGALAFGVLNAATWSTRSIAKQLLKYWLWG